jgi:hypothetical protein
LKRLKTNLEFKASNRTVKLREKIARPRFAQLEENVLRKTVYTGDSYQAYAPHPNIIEAQKYIGKTKEHQMTD